MEEIGLEKEIQKTYEKGGILMPKNTRSKTSLRMRYEVQAENIAKEIGDLEVVRHRLNLSKRKICQLLLIDPSTWTRWTNFNGKKAPPHIYKMLQWYLLLQDKHPEMHSDYWLRSFTNQSANVELIQSQKDIHELRIKMSLLEKRYRLLITSFISTFLMLALGFIYKMF